MTPPSPPAAAPAAELWFTRTLAAALVGLGPRQFDDVVRPRLAASAARGEGRRLRYHGPDVVAAWHAYRLEQLQPRNAPGGRDTLGPGDLIEDENAPDSPALERLRLARAIDAELDLEERWKRLIPRDELEPALASFAAVLRRAGELLQRRHGDDAAAILNEAVDEAVVGWEAALAVERDASPDGDHGPEDGRADPGGAAGAGRPGADAAATVDARVRRAGNLAPQRPA